MKDAVKGKNGRLSPNVENKKIACRMWQDKYEVVASKTYIEGLTVRYIKANGDSILEHIRSKKPPEEAVGPLDCNRLK